MTGMARDAAAITVKTMDSHHDGGALRLGGSDRQPCAGSQKQKVLRANGRHQEAELRTMHPQRLRMLLAVRIAVEYDDPGRSRRAHHGLKQASDREKDDPLAEVGWEVIRIRAGGLESLGANSIVCASLTIAAVDRVVERMRELRGDTAVDAILA